MLKNLLNEETKNMRQTNGSSKDAQHKIAYFLKEEVAKLKSNHELDTKNKIMKRKAIDKKRQKLYQKIEAVLKIYPLDTEVKEVLLNLQQEIKGGC
jgi:hypothetical protein